MTTNQGLRVSEDEHSLKAGVRGPTLMEDFISGENDAL
ncbi:KatE2 [Bacillus subtilis]|nr:KatE2 [Bacillus subtilis]